MTQKPDFAATRWHWLHHPDKGWFVAEGRSDGLLQVGPDHMGWEAAREAGWVYKRPCLPPRSDAS